jgi:hypothetical protein
VYPDWDLLLAEITAGNISWDDLCGINWDGFKITLPDGSFHFPSINLSLPISIPSIQIPKISGGTFNLSFTGISLGLPWHTGGFGFGSRNGIDFGFTLPSFSNPFSLPEFRELFGRLLSFKFGKWGLFLSGFFKLNPDLSSFNLRLHLNSFGGDFQFPNINWPDVNLPSGWLPSFNGGGGSGMWPFNIPIDWPEIDWGSFDINNPWPSIKQFFIDLFSGHSRSGEPFAFPALRWIWGLLSGGLPDLRLPNLGWGDGDGGFNLKLPEVPLEISGDGSYENPWAVPLTPFGLESVEFIVWLDPDGLPSTRLLDLAKSVLDPQLLSMIESTIDSVTTEALDDEFWISQMARLLNRLGNISPRVDSALNGLSEGEISRGLSLFNRFMTESDGLVPLDSQLYESNPSWSNQSATHVGMHWNAMKVPAVIADVTSFVTGNVTSLPSWVLLLIQAPWNDEGAWDEFLSDTTDLQNVGLVHPSNRGHFDLTTANTPGVSLNSLDISAVGDSQTQIYTLKLASIPPAGSNLEAFHIEQLEFCVQHILNLAASNTKIAIVGHSIGGLATRRYVDSGSGSSSEVVCVSTIATPHDGFLLEPDDEVILRKITHLLELIGFGGRASNITNLVVNALGDSANRVDVEESITMITQNREGIIPGGGP